MKQYYKIGEISEIYGIGKDSLMYYEDLGIIKPSRGENGYISKEKLVEGTTFFRLLKLHLALYGFIV